MSHPQPVPRIIFWVIWFALLSGVLVMNFAIAPPEKPPISDAGNSLLWLVAVVPLLISALVRWFVLPRATTAQTALPVFIIGMALAESTAILGMFVFSGHRAELVALGLLGIGQFMPTFAAKLGGDTNR